MLYVCNVNTTDLNMLRDALYTQEAGNPLIPDILNFMRVWYSNSEAREFASKPSTNGTVLDINITYLGGHRRVTQATSLVTVGPATMQIILGYDYTSCKKFLHLKVADTYDRVTTILAEQKQDTVRSLLFDEEKSITTITLSTSRGIRDIYNLLKSFNVSYKTNNPVAINERW